MRTIASCLLLLLIATAVHCRKEPGLKSPHWKRGKMTYYWASENGKNTGFLGDKLIAGKSIALKTKLAHKHYNERVEIRGMGIFIVQDACLGRNCKDIDFYTGKTRNGHDGVKEIQYRFV